MIGSDLPEDISGYWIFTDDMNFNTGYPKATLKSINLSDFNYVTPGSNVKSIAPTLTGKWAPVWNSNETGGIRVGKIRF